MRKHVQGFSLMELLVVIVIVGILAAVGYPNYRDYVTRAKRNEARAALLQIATRQESFYLQNQTYTQNMTALGFAADDNVLTETGAYRVDVAPGADATGYVATATYQDGGREAALCQTFQINGQGVKSSGPMPDCWTRTR